MANEKKLPELPYERIAMIGGEMPDGLEWYDRQMFLMLRALYWQYKQGVVDRETASREKRKLLKCRDFNLSQDRFTQEFAKKASLTEQARQEYRKNRTLENADAMIMAFEGVPVKKTREVNDG